MSYQKDQEWTKEQFERHLMPALINDLNCSIVTASEGDFVGYTLDKLADVDALAVSGADVFGIGYRIQPGEWDTFTIRLTRDSGTLTQFDKLARAIKTPGNIYPRYTVQCYLTGDTMRYAVADTRQLIDFITTNRHNPALVEIQRTSNARFLVVRFESIEGLPWCAIREKKIEAGTLL